MKKFYNISFCILLLAVQLNSIVSSQIYPVAIFHGMGDACEFPGMKSFTQSIQDGLGDSVYVKCIESGEFIDSIMDSLIHQSERACELINEDENFKGQTISVLGLSQGGLIARYITEQCDFGGKVARYISAGGPHMGVSTFPNCNKGITCVGLNSFINKYVYTDLAQDTIGPAQMWNNPKNQEAYLAGNKFLPILNNQLEDQNSQYQSNIEDLESMMLVMFQADSVVNPPSSAWFYYYNSKNKIVPITEQSVYEDLGLKTLSQDRRLQFVTFPGDHLEITQSEINQYFIPSLKGTFSGSVYESVDESQVYGQKFDFDIARPDELINILNFI